MRRSGRPRSVQNLHGANLGRRYSLVTPEHPARPGEVLIAYATNLDSYAYVFAPSLKVNGRAAVLFYSGLTPGSIGVFQVNFRLPEDTPAGDAIVQAVRGTCFPFGGCSSITYEHSRTAKLPAGTMQ